MNQKTVEICTNQSVGQNESNNAVYCIVWRPLIRLIYRPVQIIEHIEIKQISYCLKDKNKSRDNEKRDSGLDCSGQGECQPDIENSDGDRMQQYLVKANRKNKVCGRRKKSAKQSKSVEKAK